MKRIIDNINDKRMPAIINRDNDIYKALFGKYMYTENPTIDESSDYNCGAIANELEFLRSFIDYIIDSFDFQNAETSLLEKVVCVFMDLIRIYQEEDSELRNRFKAYIWRNSNTRWMTKWSFKDIFSYFFDSDNIYIEENYIETDLVSNGGFEQVTGDDFDDWTESVAGSSTITRDTPNPFEDNASAKFSIDSSGSSASVSQTINSVVAGEYKLCFWYKDDGNCPIDDVVKIFVQRSSDSYYWSFDDEQWQSGAAYKSFPKSTEWAYAYGWIDNEGTENLTIKIENNSTSPGTAHSFYTDRVKFGIWQDYPSIKLIIVFEGLSTEGNISAWEGAEDNLIDRGECEDTTSPMIFDETTPMLVNCSWTRSGSQYYWGSYSYLFTVTTGGSIATLDLVDNNSTSDMHGLVSDQEYTFTIRLYIPSGGITGSEIKIQIMDYVSSWEIEEQAAADIYDDWQYITVTKIIRSSATGIIIRIKTDDITSSSETFYVDDVRIFVGSGNNMEYATFFDQFYIAGEGGSYTSDFYLDLLEKAKPAGCKSAIEMISRII